MQQLIQTALSITEAADRIAVSEDQIRQRIGERTLWAVRFGDDLLLPIAQFARDSVLPYLDEVLPLIPENGHPLAVLNALTSPMPGLTVDGEAASVAQVLAVSPCPPDALRQVADLLRAAEWESA